MIVSALVKILFFYLLFLVARNIYRTYKTISFIRGKMDQAMDNTQNPQKERSYNSGETAFRRSQRTSQNDGVVEAEFRVLDEKDT